jgi:hypothetical protein
MEQWGMHWMPSFRRAAKAEILLPVLAFLYILRRFHYAPAYAVSGAVILAVGMILMARWDRVEKSLLAPLILLLPALILPFLGVRQSLQFRDPGDVDFACYVCALWNMAHGSTRYSIADMDIFGSHANYTVIFWLPIHMLTGEIGLKIGKAVCLLTAVWLAIRRHQGNLRVSSWAGLALLLSPPIASQFFFGFHPEFLAAPLLVLAMDAYREERLGRFTVYAGLMAYSKEVFTLAVGGLLLLALIERRPWKWILIPGLLCCAQMALYWFVIMPHFAPLGMRFNPLMPSSPAVAASLVLRRQTLKYVLELVLPFLPLMLASPRRYLLIPVPLMLFYSVFPDSFRDLWRHYQFPIAILCMAGFILEKNAARWSGPRGRTLLACAIAALLCAPYWGRMPLLPGGDFARARNVERIHQLIPETASVMVSGPFTTRFAARKEVMDWVYRVKPFEAFDYVVIDAKFKPEWAARPEALDRDLDSLSRSPDWVRMIEVDSLYLFRRETGIQ